MKVKIKETKDRFVKWAKTITVKDVMAVLGVAILALISIKIANDDPETTMWMIKHGIH